MTGEAGRGVDEGVERTLGGGSAAVETWGGRSSSSRLTSIDPPVEGTKKRGQGWVRVNRFLILKIIVHQLTRG